MVSRTQPALDPRIYTIPSKWPRGATQLEALHHTWSRVISYCREHENNLTNRGYHTTAHNLRPWVQTLQAIDETDGVKDYLLRFSLQWLRRFHTGEPIGSFYLEEWLDTLPQEWEELSVIRRSITAR